MYNFHTRGLVCRKTVVTSTGMVQYVSTCMAHAGSSKYGFATAEAVL